MVKFFLKTRNLYLLEKMSYTHWKCLLFHQSHNSWEWNALNMKRCQFYHVCEPVHHTSPSPSSKPAAYPDFHIAINDSLLGLAASPSFEASPFSSSRCTTYHVLMNLFSQSHSLPSTYSHSHTLVFQAYPGSYPQMTYSVLPDKIFHIELIISLFKRPSIALYRL